MKNNSFNEDYFESGVSKHISLYENYHWIPERSLREAFYFINYFKIRKNNKIIDFGCAKGFFVKAMRILDYECFGFDISDYAIKNADQDIKKYLYKKLPDKIKFDFGLCKDVLEHCRDKKELLKNIEKMLSISKHWLIIVPIAKNKKFIIDDYEKDITHVLRYTKEEWVEIFKKFSKRLKIKANLIGFKDKVKDLNGNLFIII